MIIYYRIAILFCYLCILLDKKEICNAEYYCDRKWCDPPSAVPDEGTGEYDTCRRRTYSCCGKKRGRKSILVDTITGRWPLLMNEVKYDFSPSPSKMAYENIKYIAFRDSYGDADGNYYYQQRWNAHDLDETPLVRDLLPEATDSGLEKALYELFGMERMLDKHIILLSSGELRKFQLTKTLLSNPRVLIMDNPFIGLDAKTRDLLHTLLGELTKVTHLQVILILSKSDDIPAFITHVIPVEDRVCGKR